MGTVNTPQMISVTDAMAKVAEAPDLLVALDFDGTLADFNDDPMAVCLREGNPEVIARLAAMKNTAVMLVSGRDLETLRTLSALGPSVTLVGSHGAEPEGGLQLTAEQRDRLAEVDVALQQVVDGAADDGAFLERKPAHRVVHVRPVQDPERREQILTEASDKIQALNDAHLHTPIHFSRGKGVIEATVVEATKGSYLSSIRGPEGAKTIIFIGDDVTDETVLQVLQPQDVGIKVGDGDTAATCRVPDTAAVTEFLVALADARESALSQ